MSIAATISVLNILGLATNHSNLLVNERGSGRITTELTERGSGRIQMEQAYRGSGRIMNDQAYRGSGRLMA